jgi:hypothetical protein
LVKRERSEDTFLLVDESGCCVIDPDHAEVYTIHRQKWDWAGYKYKMAYVAPGDTPYALGELRTQGGADSPMARREDVRAVLRKWKQDSAGLLSRFDLNKDGAVDLKEWEAARAAAQRQVEARHLAAALEADIHVLRTPPDGRPFLLATADPDTLARRYRRWAWLHLGALVGSASTALVLSMGAL